MTWSEVWFRQHILKRIARCQVFDNGFNRISQLADARSPVAELGLMAIRDRNELMSKRSADVAGG
jgi:hypothetical protein